MDAVRGDEDAAGLLFGHSVHCQRVNAGEGHCRQVAIHAPGQEAVRCHCLGEGRLKAFGESGGHSVKAHAVHELSLIHI